MSASILIVDDNEFMRLAIRHLLGKTRPDWVVCGEAGNGKDAVSAVRKLRPNVVVLDESMPGMSGVETARHIADLQTETHIILLSAYEQKDMQLAAKVVGLASYRYVDKANVSRDLIPVVEDLVGKLRAST